MKNMLLAYFNTSEHKRSEVVAVLGHILNFSEDEILKVGTGSHPPNATGWFSGLLSYSGSSQSQQQHDKVHIFVVKKMCQYSVGSQRFDLDPTVFFAENIMSPE